MHTRHKELRMLHEISALRDLLTDALETLGDDHQASEQLRSLHERSVDLYLFQHDVRTGAERLEVAIVGNFNAGKSTFINSLLGGPVCPVGACPTTSSITRFRYGRVPAIVRDDDTPVTQEEYSRIVRHPPDLGGNLAEVHRFDYSYPLEVLRDIVLIDTPGFANPENPRDTDLTVENTQRADALFFLMDIAQGDIGADTLERLRTLRARQESGRPWYLVLNKADLKPASAAGRVRDHLLKEHADLFQSGFLYSALKASQGGGAGDDPVVSHITGLVSAALAKRAPLTLQLVGEPLASGYKVTAGERSFLLASGADHMYGPHDVVAELKALALTKGEILEHRMGQDLAVYRKERKQALERLRTAMKRDRGPDSRTKAAVALQKKLKGALEQSAKAMEATGRAAAQSVQARNLSKEERSYWSTPYATVKLVQRDLKNALVADDRWDRLSSQLERIAEEERASLATDRVTARIKKLPSLREAVLTQAVKDFDEILSAQLPAEDLEHIDLAREFRQEIVTACGAALGERLVEITRGHLMKEFEPVLQHFATARDMARASGGFLNERREIMKQKIQDLLTAEVPS